MKLVKVKGIITHTKDLSPTSREVAIALSQPIDFEAGAFMNLFIKVGDTTERRAYSISSSPKDKDVITFSIRNKIGGKVSPLFWNDDIIGTEVDMMGPLGLNTLDKMKKDRVLLFGYGIGVSVIKGIYHGLEDREDVKEISVMTGSRTKDEVVYKDFFDNAMKKDSRLNVSYVLSKPDDSSDTYLHGYIQGNVSHIDFNNADIYICGQGDACNALEQTIREMNPGNSEFFIEDFH